MPRRGAVVASVAAALVAAGLGGARESRAATIAWKGHTWNVTSGGMAGVCQGDPQNVTVDASGYLHLRIVKNGASWTSSELFTADRLGFGTYQWQVDGPIDTYDRNVVLGLFPYGPAAGIGADGTNEIDVEYARWGKADGPNGDWTDYPASGSTIGELSYTFSLSGGTLSTSRFVWSSGAIANLLLAGLQPPDSTAGLLKNWTYAPANPTTNVPQQPLPLGMNLWCFDAPPSNGQPVEIVVRDFTYVPLGSSAGGAGGARGGAAGGGGANPAGGAPGTTGGAGGDGLGPTGGAGGGAGATTPASTGGAAGAERTNDGSAGGPPVSGTSSSGCSCDVAEAAGGWWSLLACGLLVSGRIPARGRRGRPAPRRARATSSWS
ncbi:MAG TPA: hypothetical protein VHO67_13540 [Polyangia bacterium]|nr:hypothetical protein [Polyangia bacterium]